MAKDKHVRIAVTYFTVVLLPSQASKWKSVPFCSLLVSEDSNPGTWYYVSSVRPLCFIDIRWVLKLIKCLIAFEVSRIFSSLSIHNPFYCFCFKIWLTLKWCLQVASCSTGVCNVKFLHLKKKRIEFCSKLACLSLPAIYTLGKKRGILKGEVSLYCWPPVWLVWISLFCK
jgi:hypothetical protein